MLIYYVTLHFCIIIILVFLFQLRIAALNDPYSGNAGGVRGADYGCYREAHRAGIKGTFRY